MIEIKCAILLYDNYALIPSVVVKFKQHIACSTWRTTSPRYDLCRLPKGRVHA